ncbi:MAG: hypothetical protein WC477_01840 [Patescibacteria group bacterium]
MLFWGALTCVILTISIAVTMHYMGDALSEFQDHFLIIASFVLLIVIGAGVFLTYAVPILASDTSPILHTIDHATVLQDTPVGFPSSVEESD